MDIGFHIYGISRTVYVGLDKFWLQLFASEHFNGLMHRPLNIVLMGWKLVRDNVSTLLRTENGIICAHWGITHPGPSSGKPLTGQMEPSRRRT